MYRIVDCRKKDHFQLQVDFTIAKTCHTPQMKTLTQIQVFQQTSPQKQKSGQLTKKLVFPYNSTVDDI